MNGNRIAALDGLVLVAALVVGLVATNDDGSDSTDAAESPTSTESTSETDGTEGTAEGTADESPVVDDAPEASGPGSPSATDTPTPDASPTTTVDPALTNPDVPDLPDRGPHEPLVEIDGWLQTDIASLEELEGKVVAVQFWTFGCVNCRNTMAHMGQLYDKYAGDDFEIIGVHAPEFDFERDVDRIAEAAIEQNITWPIALDTEKRTFRTWQTDRRFWPRIYLLDRDGHVRYDRIGEYGDGGFAELDAAIGALIAGA